MAERDLEDIQRDYGKKEAAVIDVNCAVRGKGDLWFYCYYYPYMRKANLARGKKRWPCKIGCTVKDTIHWRTRIGQQFNTTGIFEPPVVKLLVRSNDAEGLEKYIKRELEKYQMNKRGDGYGTEWYEANLSEVRQAYLEFIHPGLLNAPRRGFIQLLMKLEPLLIFLRLKQPAD